MRKMLTLLLCLALLGICACAEETTRTTEMMLEGISEPVQETLYQSGSGYSLWYPTDYLTPGEQYGHTCFTPIGSDESNATYFLIVPSDANPADAELLLAEAVGGFGPEAVISEQTWTTTEGGALLGSVSAAEESTIYRYYLVAEEENLLLITACFPQEAAEGFGVRFDRMAATISFLEIPLNEQYIGADFSISYPASVLEPRAIYTHEGFAPTGSEENSKIYLMIVRSDIAPEHADELLEEVGGGYEGDYARSQTEEKALDNGLTLSSVEIEQMGVIDKYYLLKSADAVYCITASFPVMGDQDYGALFDAMVETFELTNVTAE